MELKTHYDLVIIGAGMGGSALAYALRETDLSILILERGGYVKQEPENWDPDEVIANRRYDPQENWLDEAGRPFRPRLYYNVGGSSKFFGGSSFRFREADFTGKHYPEGSTVPWPIRYKDLAPYYDEAERLMWVHGRAGADPCEPQRDDYPYQALENEEPIAWLQERLREQGLHPFPLPIAVHQGPGGRCRKGSPCDGFPCKIRAKGDGENAFLRPALRQKKDIQVVTGARVERLITDRAGTRVRTVTFTLVAPEGRPSANPAASQGSAGSPAGAGESRRVEARTVVMAAGAANSAAVLLRSASPTHPRGLANGAGLVGHNFMAHNNTVLMAFSLFRRNPTKFQKTMAINDFYLGDPAADVAGPLGNIQMRGKVLAQNLARSSRLLVRLFRRFIARRSFDFWIMSEDLPSSENRVELVSGEGTRRPDRDAEAAGEGGGGTVPGQSIRLRRGLNNLGPHRELVRRFRLHLRRAGLHFIVEREPSASTIQHQVGTLRFGTDPARSVLNSDCRSHEVENLYVVDGSVFPSSAAVNPALTIAANALRVGSILRERLAGSEASGMNAAD